MVGNVEENDIFTYQSLGSTVWTKTFWILVVLLLCLGQTHLHLTSSYCACNNTFNSLKLPPAFLNITLKSLRTLELEETKNNRSFFVKITLLEVSGTMNKCVGLQMEMD